MARSYDDLKEEVEQYFRDVRMQRGRALRIFEWIKNACITRGFPETSVWFRKPGVESERGYPADLALDQLPDIQNTWAVELVTEVLAGNRGAGIRFFSLLEVVFDSATGPATLKVRGRDATVLEPDGSTANQQRLGACCDILLDALNVGDDESGRTIGFNTE